MKILVATVLTISLQVFITIVKKNGDELILSDLKIYQQTEQSSPEALFYLYRGKEGKIPIKEIKRISLKETLKKKKGITTYKAIVVKRDNNKLEVEMDLVKMEGKDMEGNPESMSFSSVDKISF